MALDKICGRLFSRLFSKGAAKVVEHAAPARKTISFTDKATGITTLEREINYNGGTAIAKIDQWIENGKKMSKVSIETGNHTPIYRTKSILVEPEASLFGGNKITIEKDLTKYWCYGEKSTMSKEYNRLGQLEHKEYSITHDSGNGLNDWSKKAIQDKVYDEFPLTSSVNNMLKNPLENRYFQHSLNGENNYHRFSVIGTKYERTIEANKKAALEAAQRAEAEAAAKKAAEEAALKAEIASQPRINIAKALGIGINDLQKVEKTLSNGAIQRTYFRTGSAEPVIKTVDNGILHQEWVYGGKADLIYMKQVGKESPYILAKKGNGVQILNETPVISKNGEIIKNYGMPVKNRQDAIYVYDGLYSVKYNPRGISMNGTVAEIKMPYQYHPSYKNSSEDWKRLVDRQYKNNTSEMASEIVDSNGNRISRSSYDTNIDRKLSPELKEVFESAKSDYIDLQNLYKLFEA